MLIFLAESDKNLRLALQMLLHQEAGMHVAGLAMKAEGLLAQENASQADVLLLDCYLSGSPMTAFLADLSKVQTLPKVIVLSVKPEDEKAVMSAGSDAFVTKNTEPDELLIILNSMMEEKKQIRDKLK